MGRFHATENGDVPFTPEEDAEWSAMEARNLAEQVANGYKTLRASEYPSFADQFDLLYHGGMDAWKSAIQAVKDKYPKPE